MSALDSMDPETRLCEYDSINHITAWIPAWGEDGEVGNLHEKNGNVQRRDRDAEGDDERGPGHDHTPPGDRIEPFSKEGSSDKGGGEQQNMGSEIAPGQEECEAFWDELIPIKMRRKVSSISELAQMEHQEMAQSLTVDPEEAMLDSLVDDARAKVQTASEQAKVKVQTASEVVAAGAMMMTKAAVDGGSGMVKDALGLIQGRPDTPQEMIDAPTPEDRWFTPQFGWPSNPAELSPALTAELPSDCTFKAKRWAAPPALIPTAAEAPQLEAQHRSDGVIGEVRLEVLQCEGLPTAVGYAISAPTRDSTMDRPRTLSPIAAAAHVCPESDPSCEQLQGRGRRRAKRMRRRRLRGLRRAH